MLSPNLIWLSIYFPYLSIEAINRTNARFSWAINNIADDSQSTNAVLIETPPLAVVDGPDSRPFVYAINKKARSNGINIGMTLASAKVLQHDLVALPRDTKKETQSLKRIANALLQFTPSVSIVEDIDRASIVADISASLTLFGGIDAILQRIQAGVRRMNYVARFGIAPNPLAASLFARAARNAEVALRCDSNDQLATQLSAISVQHFAWPEKTQTALHTLGLATVGDVLRQPRAGLQKRFGNAFILDLDRALGQASDAREYFRPPDTFASTIDFLFEIKDSDQLLIPIHELLIELEGFLCARGAGVTDIHLELKQGRHRSQRFDFHTRAPVRNADHWLRLVSDRIETHELDDPVVEVSLFADRISTLIEENKSLLPQEKGTSSDWHTLLDRIASKLGEKSVYRIAVHDEHRPELAWRCDASDVAPQKNISPHSTKTRPIWLLREPRSLVEMEGRPQYNGALTLLAGPERIDTGWWDNKAVARDYFVATNPHREICWVFRDYRQGKRWYLHGFFS
jgi:protein ImuB